MTIAMPDSIYPGNLPPGYKAYLGYPDGHWPTVSALKAKFPGAEIVSLTVLGGATVATGCDIENGDLNAVSGAAYLERRIAAGQKLPVAYMSVSNVGAVVSELSALHVSRSQVRLLSAHYGQGEHICGPATCRLTSVACDGTQWTDTFAGENGTRIDMSALNDGFFSGTAVTGTGGTATGTGTTWEDSLLATISTVQFGSSGQAVKNWQGLLNAHGYSLAPAGIDGSFGSMTRAQTEKFQQDRRLSVDGVVGEKTWTSALTS